MELIPLGAAGCLDSNGVRCPSLTADLAGYACAEYRVPLMEHWRGGQPVRAAICADEAEKDAWARIMRARA